MSEWWKYHSALPFQKSSWEVLHFESDHMHIHSHSSFKKLHAGCWPFLGRSFEALSSFSDAILEVCTIHSTLQCTILLIPALVLYLFTAPLSYQAFNYLIILHWAQLKHNGLCCCKSQLLQLLLSSIQSTGEMGCCSWPSIMYLE